MAKTSNREHEIKKLLQENQKLIQENKRLEIILATQNTGLALIDPDMTVSWVNDKLREIYPFGEPVGEKCYTFSEHRTEPCEDCQTRKAFQDGKIHERDVLNSLNNRWNRLTALPVKDKQGRVVQVLEASTDITLHKKMEQKLAQQLEEIQQLKDRLEAENIYLRREQDRESGFEHIIGQSDEIRYVLYRVNQVAPAATTVLIVGETGTGKGVIARAIHHASDRKEKPFVNVNCAALPGNLIESELFGREKGAFTGAEGKQIGRFEFADGGTIFLDEIVDLPMELQIKLLRVIEEGEFERLGSPRPVKVDVRIIAATNQNIEEAIRKKQFREDLYYRLNVFPITIPPLRQRREDIALLSNYFVEKCNKKFRKQITRIPNQIMTALEGYPWPGNIRELMSIIERAVIVTQGSVLQLAEPLKVLQETPIRTADRDGLAAMEREHILKTLDDLGWKIEGPDGAAQALKINPSTLRTRMKKLSIKKPKISR